MNLWRRQPVLWCMWPSAKGRHTEEHRSTPGKCGKAGESVRGSREKRRLILSQEIAEGSTEEGTVELGLIQWGGVSNWWGVATMGGPHRRINMFNDVWFGGVLRSTGWPDYTLWEWGGWGEEAGGGAGGAVSWGDTRNVVQGWHHRQNQDGGPSEPPILDTSFAKKPLRV